VTPPSPQLLAKLLAFLVSGALAIGGEELGRPALRAIFKPITTALLLAVIGWPETTLARAVAVGVLFSLLGDILLISRTELAFLAGLGAFLLAHLAYIAGFVWSGAAVWSLPVAPLAGLATALATALLLRAVWRGAGGMHGPVAVYGVVITAMVTAAFATLAGPSALAPLAAIGSLLFYASDALLALNRFRRPIRHAPLLTVGLYWAGQLGIALFARGHLR
jgi:uncharacterized membrane protein YhhN